MRLFVAVCFDEPFKKALQNVQREFKKNGIKGNYTRPENLHMTLAFIGEYDDPAKASATLDKLEFESFNISMVGAGRFSGILWMGIEDGGRLKQLASSVRSLLKNADIPYDSKAFKPHITLVRKPVMSGIPAVCTNNISMNVSRVTLMKSERINGVLTYTEISSVSALRK